MARIPLRAYLAEIESWISAGEPEPAQKHLRYILNHFPKAIGAYRLLGQALLANKQSNEAADIFLRLLSSVPDDFTSHLGLSVIRESQGNLAQAIWVDLRDAEQQVHGRGLRCDAVGQVVAAQGAGMHPEPSVVRSLS